MVSVSSDGGILIWSMPDSLASCSSCVFIHIGTGARSGMVGTPGAGGKGGVGVLGLGLGVLQV